MNISFYEVGDQEAKFLNDALAGHRNYFYPEKLSEESLVEADTEILSVFVGSVVNKKVLEKLPNLKYIAVRATGFDNVDLDYCKEKGITVSNVPAYGVNTVAEFTFALLLSLSRHVHEAYTRIREDGRYSEVGLQGFELYGKKLGIIGTGKIGARVAEISQGFGMEVVAYDPFPNKDLVSRVGVVYGSLIEVLSSADIVSLHVPYSSENHHLIDASALASMKQGAILINTARGPLVDTVALVDSLLNKHLAGAALDVLEAEGYIKDELNLLHAGHPKAEELEALLADHVLAKLPNVLVTPHMAYYTREALHRIVLSSVDNIRSFVDNKKINLVT